MSAAIHIQLDGRCGGVDEDGPLRAAVHRAVQFVVEVTEFVADEHALAMIAWRPVLHGMGGYAMAVPGGVFGHYHLAPGPVAAGAHADLATAACRVADHRPFDPLPVVQRADG
ncbi:hypothetical protein D3C80_1388600 [compost metagenome]